MAGYTPRRFTCPQAVTHSSSDRAQCRLTTLIEANALTTILGSHQKYFTLRQIYVLPLKLSLFVIFSLSIAKPPPLCTPRSSFLFLDDPLRPPLSVVNLQIVFDGINPSLLQYTLHSVHKHSHPGFV